MQLRVYNYNTMDKVKTFEAHTDYIRCVCAGLNPMATCWSSSAAMDVHVFPHHDTTKHSTGPTHWFSRHNSSSCSLYASTASACLMKHMSWVTGQQKLGHDAVCLCSKLSVQAGQAQP